MTQKIDLIAELKASKDITGIKKLKTERARLEDRHSSSTIDETSRQFTPQHFVETVSNQSIVVNAHIILLHK